MGTGAKETTGTKQNEVKQMDNIEFAKARQGCIEKVVCQLDLGKLTSDDTIRGFSYREKQNIIQQFRVHKFDSRELDLMKTDAQLQMFRAAQKYADGRPFVYEMQGGLELVLDDSYWERREFNTWRYTSVVYIQ